VIGEGEAKEGYKASSGNLAAQREGATEGVPGQPEPGKETIE